MNARIRLYWTLLFGLGLAVGPAVAHCQPPQKVGSNYQFKSMGADSGGVRLPKYQTLPATPTLNFIDTGAVAYRKSDSTWWGWTGNIWIPLGKLPTAGQGIFVNGSSVRSSMNWFNVTEYGADSTGVVDATIAIRNCITAAAAATPNGSVIFFPPGNYLISDSIVTPVGRTFYILGSGMGYNNTTGNYVTRILQSSGTKGVFNMSGNSCQVRNMALENTAATPTAGAAIFFRDIHLVVKDVSIKGFYDGIVQTDQVASVIDGCVFADQIHRSIDQSNFVSADNGDGSIANCLFSSFLHPTAVGFYQTGSGGEKIQNCKWVSASNLYVNPIEVNIPNGSQSTSDLFISNCSIEQYTGNGVYIHSSGGGNFYNITIAGGNISSYNNGNGVVLTGTGGSLSRIALTGICIGNDATAIALTDVDNVSISNCLMNNNSGNITQAGVVTNLFYDRALITYNTPASGGTVAAVKWAYNIINPAGPIALLTVALPASPVDGDEIELVFSQTITNLAYSGGTQVGPTANVSGYRKMKYYAAQTTWF